MGESRRGVSWTVDAADARLRLDKFLAASSRLASRARARTAIERGKVFVNDREAAAADGALALAVGDRVRLWEDRPGSARATPRPFRTGELEIVFEDAALVVVNKPSGLLVVPLASRPEAPTVEALLVDHLRSRGKVRPLVVHRIDRDTSGLVLFAKAPRARQALKAQFEARTASRVYLAVLHGRPDPPSGTWQDRLAWSGEELIQKAARRGDPRAKESISRYRLVQALDGASLVEIDLVSGRRNQIRIQAALHGHPLVGERQYAEDALAGTPAIDFARQALHAWRLAVDHPETGRRLELTARPPKDLRSLIHRLHGTVPA
jgi:23S rRNA pseudouridine1911/1915/1917 synthase